MNGTIIVAIITVLGSIIAAAITSYLTKAKDREACDARGGHGRPPMAGPAQRWHLG